MTLKYFAWVRERIGMAEERVDLPRSVVDVETFLDWMATRGDAYELALRDRAVLRVALDKKLVATDAPVLDVSEIAIFPPMTGG